MVAPKRPKRALITGIGGQDGHYLSELLIAKNYEVFGLFRHRAFRERVALPEGVQLLHGDLTLPGSMLAVLDQAGPDEVYNLAGMSNVGESFIRPAMSGKVNGLGAVELLESIRSLGNKKREIKFFQASSSEIFGKGVKSPQNESTLLAPTSPYGASKTYAHIMTGIYRQTHGVFACCGILYNHESPFRNEASVSRMIISNLVRYSNGDDVILKLGYLDAKRDWGFAGDYVEGMWRILQHDTPDDYVLATNEIHTVREFVEAAAKTLNIGLKWSGLGENEIGVDKKTGATIVKIDPAHYRPAGVGLLQGDYSKAKRVLGWEPKVRFELLVRKLVEAELFAQKTVTTDAPVEFASVLTDE
jgi:GDPmannose 4,6-dehydratase